MGEAQVGDIFVCLGSFIRDQRTFYLPSFTVRVFNPCIDILSLIHSIMVIFLN